MPKKSTTVELSSAASQYSSLEHYVEAVRKLLLSRKDLSAKWIDALLEGDATYLQLSFEKQEHPAVAALDIFITEEEAEREPVQADLRIKINASVQAKAHLERLVELGLWGDSVDVAAEHLLNQSLAALLASGVLRSSYPK